MQEKVPALSALIAGEPLALHEVADAIGRSPSATWRQLQELVETHRAIRTGERKEARYEPAAHVHVDSVQRAGDGWLALRWDAAEIDWMFPLASRVQYPERVSALLRAAFATGILVDVSVIAYGSTARHDARADSDSDLLVLGGPRRTWEDLAVALELDGGGRVAVTIADTWDDVPANLRRNIARDGVTVFSSTSPPWFVESLRMPCADGRRPRPAGPGT